MEREVRFSVPILEKKKESFIASYSSVGAEGVAQCSVAVLSPTMCKAGGVSSQHHIPPLPPKKYNSGQPVFNFKTFKFLSAKELVHSAINLLSTPRTGNHKSSLLF